MQNVAYWNAAAYGFLGPLATHVGLMLLQVRSSQETDGCSTTMLSTLS